MKGKIVRFSALIILLIALLTCAVGCNSESYQDIYESDRLILKSSTSTSIAAVTRSTPTEYETRIATFSGVKTLKTQFRVQENTTIDVTMKIKSGKLKLVLCSKDKVFPLLVETDHEGALSIDVPAGTYRLRMVGLEADFELHIVY